MTPERYEEIVATFLAWKQDGEARGIPQMYVELWTERGWQLEGYETWDEFCVGRLGGFRMSLPREERREAAAAMAGQGMSTRAIGSALGVSQPTVRRDLAGEPNDSPATTTGLDGKTYPPRPPRPPRSRAEDSAPRDPEAVERSRQQLQDFIESDPSHMEARYVANFFKSVVPATDIPKYDAEKLAGLLDETSFYALELAVQGLSRWFEQVKRHRRPHLIGVK